MNAVDHNNVVIFDDRGIPSIMCRFVRPKDTEEVPAVFKIGDKVADAIYISKYPNIVIDGRAYSMPMADPTVNITFDEAVQACRCKGLGWHLMTAVEYEYLLNQSREKGTMPHGNTDWGKDYYHNEEQGKVSNLGRTYTGTGPVTWNHDHTPYGVSDLKLCKKLQDGSKKKLPKPNFTKLVLVAVLFTYFVGLYIGIKVTLIDYSQFGVLATYIATPTTTVIALYCWKAKAENIIKIKKGYPEETKDISVDLNNINI